MSDKRIMRFLAFVYIVEAVVAFLAPGSMIKATRWFADLLDNPRNMRLSGIIPLALGIWLALRQHQEEQALQPWYRRWR